MAILDHRGMPVKTSELTKEVAAPTLAGVRTTWYDSVASGLTPESLGAIIAQVDQNDIEAYLTLAEEMEERDLHYHSVLSTRKLAVSSLDVAVDSFSDDAKDVEQADFVREVVEGDSFKPLISSLLDGLGKGYSASEIIWKRGEIWTPKEYKWRDPRFFVFDHETRTELRLRDDEDPACGVPLKPFKFIVHQPQIKTGLPIRGGLARLAVVAYMCKGYTLKDWMAFAEVFGLPLRVGKYHTSATEEQKAALLTAVASIGTDAACIIPENMVIEFIESSKPQGGEDMFQNLANWLDEQVSEGVIGQQATTKGTPGRLGGDDEQAQVREDIKLSDADQLSQTLRRDLVRPLIDLNFGPRPEREYPILRLFTEAPEDLESLSKALPPFIDRGLPVEVSTILDKFGLPVPEDDAQLLGSGKKPGQEEPEPGEPTPPQPPPRDEPAPPAPDGVDPENTPGDDGDEATLQREHRATVAELMRRIRRGETLTADQRVTIVAFAASQYGKAITQEQLEGGDDTIDEIINEELADWERIMDPIFQPLLDHVQASENYQEFLDGLDNVLTEMDPTEFTRRLAIASFEARGLGDGTDEI